MTGSTLNENGSHHQLPYWAFFKANNFTLGALGAFHQYIFEVGEGYN